MVVVRLARCAHSAAPDVLPRAVCMAEISPISSAAYVEKSVDDMSVALQCPDAISMKDATHARARNIQRILQAEFPLYVRASLLDERARYTQGCVGLVRYVVICHALPNTAPGVTHANKTRERERERERKRKRERWAKGYM